MPWYRYGQQATTPAENQVALLAIPEKALCDLVISTAGLQLCSIAQTREWLIKDRRIARASLEQLQPALIQFWLKQAPKKNSLQLLVKTCKIYDL